MERLEDIASRNALLGFAHRPDAATAGADYMMSDGDEIDPVSTVRAFVSLHRMSGGAFDVTTTEPPACAFVIEASSPHVITLNYDEAVSLGSTAAFSALGQLHISGAYLQQIAPMLVLVDHDMMNRAAAGSFLEYFERYLKSPFKQIQEVRERQLGAVIDSIGVAYRVPDAEPLRSRLQDLQQYWIEEHRPDEQLSIDSLSALLTFLSAHPALELPQITTTSSGTWVAQWRRDSDHAFNIHFIDATTARYSIVARKPRAVPGEAQAWGSVEISGLFDIAKAYRADRWMTREG